MFGKYNGFVSKARVSACMYFLVIMISQSQSRELWECFDLTAKSIRLILDRSNTIRRAARSKLNMNYRHNTDPVK
jgi:hypothetical protein